MKVLVVDDEPLARERLLRLLEKVLPQASLLEAGNGKQALEVVALEQPALVLLDIRMPGMDGIEVAAKIQEMDEPPAIVFCTAYDRYAMEALERQAVAYLLKPVREQQLAAAIERGARVNRMQLATLQVDQGQRSHVSAESHRGVESVSVNEVRCFLAGQKYVTACHPEGSLILTETLKELEVEFAAHFVRVHRNALVNINHVVGLRRQGPDGWQVELSGVEESPLVSRRHVSEIKERLRKR